MTKYFETTARETTGIFVACRETGEILEECTSIEEALAVIASYEEEDKLDGIYSEGYYDVVDEEHCTIEYYSITSVKELYAASTFRSLTEFAGYFGVAYRSMQNWVNEYRKCPSYLFDLMFYKLAKEGKLADIDYTKYHEVGALES